ncbi:MAG: YibE/F family protein [Clostridia bacterium]|nr:YibE/F family protein [Clostridia bacterium]
MKKILFLLMVFMISISTAFAEENLDSGDIENIEITISDEENNLILNNDDFESLNVYSEVIEAGKPEEIDDGYYKTIGQKIRIKVLDKRFLGKEYSVIYYLEDGINSRLPLYDELKVGDKVYAYGTLENGILQVDAISYYDKTPWVLLIFLIFAGLIVLIGRKNGLKALISLVLTILMIFWLLIPGILSGKNIIILTVGVCSVVILVTFIIVSGFTKKTLIAIIGTIGGIVAAAIIGALFSHLMRLTGINEHARMISVAYAGEGEMISFKNVMLSAIMISAMGACMDVGMSIASALNELKSKKKDITKRELIKSGMNIGRDVMGTMTNTLILAYVGSAMLCILLYNINGFDLSFVLNAEDITDEVLKSLSGSIGLVATIPITAILGGILLGSGMVSNKDGIKQQDNKVENENIEIPVKYFKG